MNVLLIEDNEPLRKVMRNYLKGLGHEVTTHANGKLAIEAMKDDIPDLVFTDILMPEMDGYEFLIEKMNNEALSSIPVVVISHLSSKHHRYTANQFGANGYIPKPFTKQDMEIALQKFAA